MHLITGRSRPTLAAKARLRFDRREQRFLLLSPERGLLLNRTASDILQLCTGRQTVDMIVKTLVVRHAPTSPATIRADVFALLSSLQARGLVREESSQWNGPTPSSQN